MSRRSISGGKGNVLAVILGGGAVTAAFLLNGTVFSTDYSHHSSESIDGNDQILDGLNLDLASSAYGQRANISVAVERHPGWQTAPDKLRRIGLEFYSKVGSAVTLAESIYSPNKVLYKAVYDKVDNLLSLWRGMGHSVTVFCLPHLRYDLHCWNYGKNSDFYLTRSSPIPKPNKKTPKRP